MNFLLGNYGQETWLSVASCIARCLILPSPGVVNCCRQYWAKFFQLPTKKKQLAEGNGNFSTRGTSVPNSDWALVSELCCSFDLILLLFKPHLEVLLPLCLTVRGKIISNNSAPENHHNLVSLQLDLVSSQLDLVSSQWDFVSLQLDLVCSKLDFVS